MFDQIIETLHQRGFRMTPQRLLVLQILQDAGRHLTPQEIFGQTQRILPAMTEATVYRTLSFLTEQGFILAAHIGNGQLVYEIAGHNHHHLICRACGATQQIDHQFLESLYQQFRSKTGYQIDSLHVTFFGLCPDCQKN
ncbi:MAG: Fur family transcriptional regulator [Anaerolineales bacterium]|jgi:Fe2+ or Zn2+ uptake regulation protein|nr:Fur family transcriptional regulator [Anaerolineales bacterium]